jgi:queuine/archaeosine tRNA-ribosyltransferase
MTVIRERKIVVAGKTVALPCFFPSVSSIKTNLLPVDYIELLDAAAYPLYLVSAYDIASSGAENQHRIRCAMQQSRIKESVILLDSENYENFWKGNGDWCANRFHAICKNYDYDISFCYDNQKPPNTSEMIAEDVVRGVLRDQEQASATIVPIVHGPAKLLPRAVMKVAEQLCPVLLAVPERALGEGIATRIRSVRQIRKALNELDFYCPLHLLGTGNPVSIIAYTIAGADSFDGLEWCQTVVDHKTALLHHLQQWDFVREQTEWGVNGSLPFIQSVLMHNLDFYTAFMRRIQQSEDNHALYDIMESLIPRAWCEIVRNAFEVDK